VNAIVEAVEHDNRCADADQAPESDVSVMVDYGALEGVSVQEAIGWASQQQCAVTLYLCDAGKRLAPKQQRLEHKLVEGHHIAR